MSNTDRNSLIKENRRLKHQIDIHQHEIDLIKRSKAYNTGRLLGQAKKQFKQSPAGFTKKITQRILRGTLRQNMQAVNSNLAMMSELQTQYENWMRLNEPDAVELDQQRESSDSFTYRPLISIVTPVFNPPVDVLEDLIKSVLDQTYTNFELCLGNFGDKQEVKDLLAEYALKDNRVKHIEFRDNKGIAENSNQILSKCSGEYIALLDHDDTLSPDALYENALALNEDDYDFIYSDKDKIDEAGNRFEPFFKPGWSPELMLNANYLTHLNVMKTSVVKKVGAWSTETDGAQDWDLFLKVISGSKKIKHIPKILYHWRVIATSTALSIETKPYALEGQRKAVDKYMRAQSIPGKSYHVGAELLIKWDTNNSTTIFIIKTDSPKVIESLVSNVLSALGAKLVVFTTNIKDINSSNKEVEYVSYKLGGYAKVLAKYLKSRKEDDVVFVDERVDFGLSQAELDQLKGWLTIKDVAAVSPRIINSEGLAVDCGAVITSKGIKPLFVGSASYHHSAIGNIEWIRNLAVISPLLFVSKRVDTAKSLAAIATKSSHDELVYTHIQLELSTNNRLVFEPKIATPIYKGAEVDMFDFYSEPLQDIQLSASRHDIFMNKNLSAENPMNLALVVQSDAVQVENGIAQSNSYQREAIVHAINRNISHQQLALNYKTIQNTHTKSLTNPKTVLFILPDFTAIYAGLNNIFSFANYLESSGINVSFAIMADSEDTTRHRELIRAKYPNVAEKAQIHIVSTVNVDSLPAVDIAICTQWATAYLLALFNKTKRKCYFIQDKESSFYPKGSIAALVEFTYSLGFYGLAGTKGLLEWYKSEFNGAGIILGSVLNLNDYNVPKTPKSVAKKPYKVFFYARPNEPRNAFEIGAAGLSKLKERLGDDVEIYGAGADWDPLDYDLDGVITNLGRISYDKLPAFYRDMDAGLMFMFSGHPGVVASELMASGCPVVVNEYNDVTWSELYSHERTCLTTTPVADEIADNMYRILTDQDLRATLIPNGRKKATEFYGGYEDSCQAALESIKKPI